MATEKKITGAVGGAGRVFRAGDEAAFAEFLKTDAGKTVDLAHLTKSGHIVGYTSDEVEPAILEPVNRQRYADGSGVAAGKKASAAERKAARNAAKGK